MTDGHGHGLHPDEGDVVRLLDGELDAETTARIHAHIATCEECALDVEVLRQTSRNLSRELATDVIEVPSVGLRTPFRRRSISVPLKVAAGLAVLIPLSATLRPVRAFMSSGWEAVVEVLGFSRAEPASPMIERVPAPSPGAIVSFVPRGSTLIIDVTAWQTGGAVQIDFGSANTASAQILTPSELESITVLPNRGIRIGTTESSSADYRVVVPNSLNLVLVMVDGVEVAEIEPVVGGQSIAIPLTR